MVQFFGFELSTYVIIMIVFLLFLLVVLVLGDVGDFFDIGGDVDTGVDAGLSPVSLPVIGVFGTAFGGYGAIFEAAGFGSIFTPVLAVVLALSTAGGVWGLMYRVFVKTQAETRVDLNAVLGLRGQVSVPIRPGHPGQVVVVTDARGRTLLQAVSEETIGTDEHVVVDSVVGSSVRVHRV